MTKTRLLSFSILPLLMMSCNLYGGLSKPSNDQQYLVAARACLDHGDYECARQNYEALSNSYNDIKISEGSLNSLAEGNIFSISDLVGSLGTNLGSASSFTFLAEALATRGVIGGAQRTVIKTAYDNDTSIQEPKLKAFSKFIAALAMLNEVLGNAVGADGKLSASDIVDASAVTACKAQAGALLCNACTHATITQFTYNAGDASDMNTTAGANADWSGPATIQKFLNAATSASTQYSAFASGSTDAGLLKAIQQLSALGVAAEDCVRYGIINILGL
jgi:hypothetical protein